MVLEEGDEQHQKNMKKIAEKRENLEKERLFGELYTLLDWYKDCQTEKWKTATISAVKSLVRQIDWHITCECPTQEWNRWREIYKSFLNTTFLVGWIVFLYRVSHKF